MTDHAKEARELMFPSGKHWTEPFRSIEQQLEDLTAALEAAERRGIDLERAEWVRMVDDFITHIERYRGVPAATKSATIGLLRDMLTERGIRAETSPTKNTDHTS